MGEHDIVRKQGNPFKSGRAVGHVAAEKFVLAVAVADQAGAAKPLDDPARGTLRNEVI
jgi:hypothetical protein